MFVGQLTEVLNVCEDTAMYQCETDLNTFQSWDIQLNSLLWYTWTAVLTTPFRMQFTRRVQKSSIIAEVISQNYSLISLITITAAASLNGSIVTCNGYVIQLKISGKNSVSHSVSLSVSPFVCLSIRPSVCLSV